MTDIKRDFLYDFNRGLRDIYMSKPSILSVFENIDNGSLKLSPKDFPEKEFLNEVGRCIFMIKKIASNPHKVIVGKQEIVPVSQAQNADHESVKLTLADPTLWSIEKGKRMPKYAYSIVNEDVFINYENAFIYQLISLLISRLKKIKAKLSVTLGIENGAMVDGNDSSDEYAEYYNTVCLYIHKLSRLSKEKTFLDNSKRVVDMSNIFVTDIIRTDKRYNYCYKFLFAHLRGHKKLEAGVSADFRVLYHNFALVQLLYGLYKSGYVVEDMTYRIPVSGKMFITKTSLSKDGKKLTVLPSRNGIDISTEEKSVHIEFSKTIIKSVNDINADCAERIKSINPSNRYANAYVSYLTSDSSLDANALSIGYSDTTASINKLINEF